MLLRTLPVLPITQAGPGHVVPTTLHSHPTLILVSSQTHALGMGLVKEHLSSGTKESELGPAQVAQLVRVLSR